MKRQEPKRNMKITEEAEINSRKLVIHKSEKEQIEIADFGLGQFEKTGLGVLVYVNTERCCAKELAMWPHQTCPEHRHPVISREYPGKEETFRCRWGKMYLYVPCPAPQTKATAPAGRENLYGLE
jgi:D-lyxose ketol-isomerase